MHPNKTRGAPRDHLLKKLEPKIDAYAKKLREMYHREGTIDPQKMYLNPIRMREETDTLEKCIAEKLMPGVIKGREEHDDVDLIFPWNAPYKVTRVDHGQVRPWHAIHPETEEEIRCTV